MHMYIYSVDPFWSISLSIKTTCQKCKKYAQNCTKFSEAGFINDGYEILHFVQTRKDLFRRSIM